MVRQLASCVIGCRPFSVAHLSQHVQALDLTRTTFSNASSKWTWVPHPRCAALMVERVDCRVLLDWW